MLLATLKLVARHSRSAPHDCGDKLFGISQGPGSQQKQVKARRSTLPYPRGAAAFGTIARTASDPRRRQSDNSTYGGQKLQLKKKQKQIQPATEAFTAFSGEHDPRG